MPTGPNYPTIDVVVALAKAEGFMLDDATLASFHKMVSGSVTACRQLERFEELRPEVKYPRTTGNRPSAEENPFNGWMWKCDIKGADTGVLSGYRVGIKDTVAMAGLPMRNGSHMLEGFTPSIDATIVTRILDAGGHIIGRTTCEDLSFSGAGYTSAMGAAKNPANPGRNTGGSSSGSGVVLAAGDADVAIGGDQGGSIRLPASWCGVQGLKPTYGLVPYTGIAAIEMTIDHVGPMARDSEGVARMLQAIAGHDPLDSRQRGIVKPGQSFDFVSKLQDGIKGKRIAVLKEGFSQDGKDIGVPAADPAVDAKVRAAIEGLRQLGAEVEEVSVPMHMDAYYIWSVIATQGVNDLMLKGAGNGSNFMGWYDTALGEALTRGLAARPNDLPPAAMYIILASEYLNKTHGRRYYWKAQNQRHLVSQAYEKVFESFDMIAMPTTPFTATKQMERDAPVLEFVANSLNMLRNTCVADLTGHPSMSIPCGNVDGLPVGLMLTGRNMEDMTLLQAARAFETLGDWKSL